MDDEQVLRKTLQSLNGMGNGSHWPDLRFIKTPDDWPWRRRLMVPLNPVPFDIKQKLVVNKVTHRIKFENETETEVTIIVEPKNVTD